MKLPVSATSHKHLNFIRKNVLVPEKDSRKFEIVVPMMTLGYWDKLRFKWVLLTSLVGPYWKQLEQHSLNVFGMKMFWVEARYA